MIAFDLECCNGHQFEGWFQDRQAYEEQCRNGLISCPICNEKSVSKVLSAVAIRKSPSHPPAAQAPDAGQEDLHRKIATFVRDNFDDVGCDFAKETLKMHYGVSEPRNIRGVSTQEEEKQLKEEGIQFFKIPLPQSSDTDS
jgi:hypothetical protein